MHRLRRCSARSAQALAVDGDRAQSFVLVGAAAVSCKPRTHRRVHRVAVQTCQESAERGRPRCGPQPQAVTDLAGQVGGMPCDGGEGGGAGEYGDRAQCQDRAEPVTAALSTARIGQHVEDVGKVQQAVGVVGDGARIVVEVAGHSGNQRGWHPEAVRCDEASDTSIITNRFLQLITYPHPDNPPSPGSGISPPENARALVRATGNGLAQHGESVLHDGVDVSSTRISLPAVLAGSILLADCHHSKPAGVTVQHLGLFTPLRQCLVQRTGVYVHPPPGVPIETLQFD